MNTPLAKSLLIFFIILAVITTTFTFAILHHDDGDDRVQFSLIDHNGVRVTQKSFAGKHQLVFFGFTSCHMICPTQMSKLTQVINRLESSKYANRITPTFISVDPERDSPEKVSQYLESFHQKFIGLTGSRIALKNAADSFKTLLAKAPENPQEEDYQISHASVVYILDPFNRLIDFIPFEDSIDAMVKRIEKLL